MSLEELERGLKKILGRITTPIRDGNMYRVVIDRGNSKIDELKRFAIVNPAYELNYIPDDNATSKKEVIYFSINKRYKKLVRGSSRKKKKRLNGGCGKEFCCYLSFYCTILIVVGIVLLLYYFS